MSKDTQIRAYTRRDLLRLMAGAAGLSLVGGCGGTSGTTNPGGGGGGGQYPEDGPWKGTFVCLTHPDPLYPNGFHEFGIEFQVQNKIIVQATSKVSYVHPDGYQASNIGAISGKFYAGGMANLERIEINPLPGHSKHTLTKLIGNSVGNLNNDGTSPLTHIYGEVLIAEFGDNAPLGDVPTDYYIDVTKQ